MTAMRSARKIASSMPWVTSTVVVRSRIQMLCSSRFMVRLRIWSSAPNGSSSRISEGLVTRARAIETRCRIPPDSWPGTDFSNPLSPTSSISACTRSAAADSGRPSTSSGSMTLRSTERQGSRAASWNAMPSSPRLRNSCGVAPRIWMIPSSGSSRPAISRSRVDLPQPDGPIRAMNSPRAMSSDTLSSATTSRPLLMKRRST